MRSKPYTYDAIIRREYTKKSGKEIADGCLIKASTVRRVVERLGLKHDEATIERLKRKCHRNLLNINVDKAAYCEAVRRGVRRARRIHRIKLSIGSESPYHYQEKTITNRAYKAKFGLRKNFGYLYDDNEPYTMRYDEHTRRIVARRTFNEAYYEEKYKFTFKAIHDTAEPESEEETFDTTPSSAVRSFIC